MGRGGYDEEGIPLFETRVAKGRVAYRSFAVTVFLGICLIWSYRLIHIPAAEVEGRWAWIGMFVAELWFGFYWIITQAVRWNPTYRYPFKDRLMSRYREKLPAVDIFICTADPKIEPPSLVVNTVLSVLAYNHPPEKLSVYLSDDGGSEFTFYALLEASRFSKHWIPFCKKFKVEPRSPAAYFAGSSSPQDAAFAGEWLAIKKLFEDMKRRIEMAVEVGISEEIKNQHKGFSEWSSKVTKQDHHSIVQIIVDGRDSNAVDNDKRPLPTLVYLAREKRPHYRHNFKAGSMNALIRVSSEISNAPIILNLDCDMYSNDPDAVQEALCFFMDEERGHQVSYVQHPQCFENLTKNDLYFNSASAVHKIELAGLDGFGGALYCGTGCFHSRQSLCGQTYSDNCRRELDNGPRNDVKDRTAHELEEAAKALANCSYEIGSQWGKEMGLVYGCPVEDIVTGLTIQCRGWKPVYYYPERRPAFLGFAPISLGPALLQYKRWAEGLFQIFFSKYCPFFYGHGNIKLGAQMGYCVYLLWAPTSFPTLFYVAVPSLCLLRDIALFPEVTSPWFLPFAYVFIARNMCSVAEALASGDTLKAWWNSQRMVLIRRTTSYLFAFVDTVTRQLGFSETTFAVTSKVSDDDVSARYGREVMEFSDLCNVFSVIVVTLAILNLFALVNVAAKMAWGVEVALGAFRNLAVQIFLSWVLFTLYLPVYEAMVVRKDKGRLPSSVVFRAAVVATVAYFLPVLSKKFVGIRL
ncbi:Cellulose synthase (UDP-forming) [Bertholletia excelsa]